MALPLSAPASAILLIQEDDVARRRLQTDGDLYEQGGWWKLRWRIDVILPDGTVGRRWCKPVVIGPARKGFGMKPLTKTEARRVGWEQYLSRLDQNQRTPLSMMSVAQFVEKRFTPGHVDLLKPAGRAHYANMLRHVLPEIGDLRLCDVKKVHVQALVSKILTGTYTTERRVKGPDGKITIEQRQHSYSVQTAKHVKTVVSAIFTYAESEDCYSGTNPAKWVKLPELTRREKRALTLDQVRQLYAALGPLERTLVLLAVMTSMNISEILGLVWRRLNLLDEWLPVDGEALPPKHLAVRMQWYRGKYITVKRPTRRRNIPLVAEVQSALQELGRREKFTGPDDFVFACSTGKPVDEHNLMARKIKPAATKLGMPWLSWHVLRHTHATLTKQVGLADYDRMRLMGHGALSMTDRYTHQDVERQRQALEEISGKLFAPEGKVQ